MNKLADLDVGEIRGLGPLGLKDDPTGISASSRFTTFITTLIGVMTLIAIIWFIIQFLIGAVGILASSGDKGKVAEAKGKITYAVIGLIVVIAAIFFIGLVGEVLGIPSILNLPHYITCLGSQGAISCQF
jgi:hypothetical protein